MPSHFSSIGFQVQSNDEMVALARRVALERQIAGRSQIFKVKQGRYLSWFGEDGEEIWLQLTRDGGLMGINPHYSGKSSVRVGLINSVRREHDSPLDGAFYCWASPTKDTPDSGEYPFVFDCSDSQTYPHLQIPGIAEAQIAAFAHQVSFYDSPASFSDSQENTLAPLASRSFIPSGLFTPQGENIRPPEAQAIITGHVIEGSARKNSLTGHGYYWALVETFGGRFDVVIDETLLPTAPFPGGVVSGTFWLSGRLSSYPKRGWTWFRKCLGGV